MSSFESAVYTVWGFSAFCVILGLVMFLIGVRMTNKVRYPYGKPKRVKTRKQEFTIAESRSFTKPKDK